MASTIKLKNGSGAPTTGDLVQGEPALDLTNKRLYTENASGVVIEVGTNPSTIDINAGTIDGTVIGGSTAAAGTFTTGQFNTSLNVDGTTNLDVVDIDGAVDMASTLTVGGTTNDGTTLAQIVQSGTGRAFSVNRNVASATRAVVNLAQLQASGGAEAVLDIQQTTPASRAIKVTPDGSIDRFSVYGTGALVTTPVAGGHAVFNEGGADADFRVESATTANALFVEGSSGLVGIGTSSLSSGLRTVIQGSQAGGAPQTSGTTQTYGLLRLQGTGFTAALDFGTNGGNYAWIQSTDQLNLGTNYPLVLNPNGSNVGIGVSSPASTLDIFTPTNYGLRVSDGTYTGVLVPSALGGLAYGTTSNHPSIFLSNNSERMRIDASGNLIIGGTTAITDTGTPSLTLGNGAGNPSLNFYGTSAGQAGQISFGDATSGTGAYEGYLLYDNANNFMAFGTNHAERLRIDSSGSVGIGTSPSVKFHVSGQSRVADSSNAANYMTFGVGANAPYGNASISTTTAGLAIVAEGAGNMTFLNNGSERMRIDSSGNVGIGTSSPTASVPLTIVSDSGNAIAQNIRGRSDGIGVLLFSDNSDVENGRIDFRTNYAEIKQTRNAPLIFSTNNTERVRIDSSGNLLVGTTVNSDGHKLSVDSGIKGVKLGNTQIFSFNPDNLESGETLTVTFEAASTYAPYIIEYRYIGFAGENFTQAAIAHKTFYGALAVNTIYGPVTEDNKFARFVTGELTLSAVGSSNRLTIDLDFPAAGMAGAIAYDTVEIKIVSSNSFELISQASA
jgi:hypothetical protein